MAHGPTIAMGGLSVGERVAVVLLAAGQTLVVERLPERGDLLARVARERGLAVLDQLVPPVSAA